MHLALANPHTPSVMAGGRTFSQAVLRRDWQHRDVQRALEHARAHYGHALCLCRREPLKLQVRMRERLCHLAVWPHEGMRHDSDCLFFRDDLIEESRPQAGSQPAKSTGDMGEIALPGHVASDPRAPRTAYSLTGGGATPAGSIPVSLRSLAVLLWDRSSLCKWHPAWTRDWGRTRFEIMRCAETLSINGFDGETMVFVPRPYRVAAQDTLNAEWDRFFRAMRLKERGNVRLLIAPVRRISAHSDSHPPVVHLRHLRAPVALTPPSHDFLQRDCRSAVQLLNARERLSQDVTASASYPEVIGFFLVEANTRGAVIAKAAWLLAVHPRVYIPAAGRNVVLMIDQLLRQCYAFEHILSEHPPSRRTTADWLVRHVLSPEGKPVARAALEVVDRGSTPEYLQVRAGIAANMHSRGIPTWTWVPHGPHAERSVPPLPPHDGTDEAIARAALDQLATASHSDYTNGPSTKFYAHERKTA